MPFIAPPVVGPALYFRDRPGRAPSPSSEPGPGPSSTLLLIHGLAVTARVWEPMTCFLGPQRRVVAYDQRNHGRSGTSAQSSLEANMADLVAVIEELDLDRPIVVGSSVGALYAVEVALRRPDLVGGVVSLSSPGYMVATDQAFRDANRQWVAGLRSDRVASARAAVPDWFGTLGSAAMVEWVVEQIAQADPHCGAVLDSLIAYDPRERLAGLSVPIHFVHGALDSIPPQVSLDQADLSGLATAQVIPGVGHMPHLEAPGLIAGVVEESAARFAAGRQESACMW